MMNGGTDMKIWVVDDEPFALKLIGHQLGSLGYSDVEVHSDSRQAIAKLVEGSDGVDMLFLDLQMPDIDGIEFVRVLGRIGFGGGVVLVSGEDGRILHAAHSLAQRHRLKVVGSLSKPLAPEQLQGVMAKASKESAALKAAGRKAYTVDEVRRAVMAGEMLNYYEPQVSFASGELVGVETLVRWQHPVDGLVYPGEFVPIVEADGLIDEMTRQVLSAALKQLGEWQRSGLALRLSVNVAMDSLDSLDFPDLVACEAAAVGVPPASLVLELTESQVMTNPQAVLDIAARLRLKRIGLSIDDFGTGHSSLAQLRDIPFDELKIDRGFIHGAAADEEQAAIVEASVDMARKLRMTTVAEGVETREDWQFARQAGCDVAQGYLIGKAMPPADFEAWHRDWQQRRSELAP